jgi:UPF0755 protein
VRRAARLALLGCLIGACIAGIVAWIAVRSLDQPLHLAVPIRYKVVPGVRFARVAADLGAQGVVTYPRAWVLLARFKGQAAAVKAGEYVIEPGLTPRSLLAKMVKGTCSCSASRSSMGGGSRTCSRRCTGIRTWFRRCPRRPPI